MEITKEMLQSRVDRTKLNLDSFMQGYMSALAELAKEIEESEKKEKKND